MDDVVEPAAEDLQLPRVLAALAEPNRLATVQYVARSGESCCSEVIAEAGLAMTKSTFSHHLRILREAGVLTKRIQGTKGYTKVRKDDLDRRFPGLIDAIIDAENQDFPPNGRVAPQHPPRPPDQRRPRIRAQCLLVVK